MMKSLFEILWVCVWGILLCNACTLKRGDDYEVKIIPKVNQQQITDDVQCCNLNMIYTDAEELDSIGHIYQDELKLNLNLTHRFEETSCGIFLSNDTMLVPEEYSLSVNDKGININACDDKGFHYALQSLRQLQFTSNGFEGIPSMIIKDKPRFSWRGLHVDVSRHFYGVEKIKEILDWMSFYKMNRFHWHLVDDQGWRIEIKKYPLLTEIGAKRVETDGSVYGPFFYTQKQIKEVVEYATARHIEVIPEIELPGHTVSVLAAYPQLSCTEKEIKVGNTWGVYKDVYCAGKDETFQFLEDVFTEVVALFPFQYIQIGGDECPKERWQHCNACQHRIQEEGLKDEDELQAYFVERIADFLASKGKTVAGWDEILEGYLPEDALVMSWHGTECGEIAVRNGNPAVMSPRSYVYFDKYQGEPEVEPLAIGGYVPLKRVYDMEPIPEGLSAAHEALILGVQGNMWTEHIPTEDHFEYMLMPRMLALAEVGWTDGKNRKWDDFHDRLQHHYPILDHWKVNYHIPIPEGKANHTVFINKDTLQLACTDSSLSIYYQLKDSNWYQYDGPIVIHESCTIKVFSKLSNGKRSRVRTIHFEKVEPMACVEPIGVTGPGLMVQWCLGDLKSVEETQKSKWIDEGKTKEIEKARSLIATDKTGAIQFTGYVKIPETEVYEFFGHPDCLEIDDVEVLNCEERSKRIQYSGQVALKEGWHKIRVTYLVRDHLSMPSSKVKTELSWRIKEQEWQEIKEISYAARIK
ncbi:hypothetical protein EYV94_20230 [Puteibacter caeruleilacunae]|nr:hypothetical protein EYV94_20230 [Puteibacter caeruleilacunae]